MRNIVRQWLWISGIGLLIICLIGWAASRVLVVTKIECVLDQHPCSEEIARRFDLFLHQPLLFSAFKSQALHQLAETPEITVDRLQKALPGTLQLFLVTVPGEYLIRLPPSDQIWQVSIRGELMPLDSTSTPGLPLATLDQQLKPPPELTAGATLPAALHQFLQASARSLVQQHLNFEQWVVVSSTSAQLLLPDGRTAVFDANDPERQLSALTSILKHLNEESEITRPPIIDLRFNLPVLKSTLASPSPISPEATSSAASAAASASP